MCFSTVYIMAHYAIDAFAGLASGALLYFLLMWVSREWKEEVKGSKKSRGK